MSANRWSGVPDQAARAIEAAMARGNKIEAIRIYRQATNCGLKEAKEAVEAVEFGSAAEAAGANDWRRQMAARVRKAARVSWLTIVLALIVVAVILVALLVAQR
jgi:ribosomal protein L7/L12